MEKTNHQLLEELGINLKRINSQGKTLCPKCSHTRKKKTDPCLSVDVNRGIYNCHNSCGFSGSVGKPIFEPRLKEYERPKFINTTQLGQDALNWFFSRGITPITLNNAKVTEGITWMPQTQGNRGTVDFNYFRNGELINIKHRDDQKNFRLEKNAELIFYGLDDIKEATWCIITEGEMDKLSFDQCGRRNTVSVPNGASKSNVANLEYLDNCIDYFENMTKIIIATDDDEPGRHLREELARRLGYERCYKVDFKGYKDANEYLMTFGEQELSKIVDDENLIEFPLAGIINSDMIWDKVEWLFENGLERGDTTHVMSDFDKYVSFVGGQLMALTGIPNHGKSPFALNIAAGLSLYSKWKWALFTPEHKPLEIFIVKVCELLLGKRARKGFGFTNREKEVAKAFINEHFIFIEPEDEDYTLDNILLKAKQLVAKKGIKGLIIDPWNKLEHNIPSGLQETAYVSRELDKIIKFDQRHSVFTILVAHPTKIRKNQKTGLFEVPNLYDISGSANFFNKVDIGVTFYRNYFTKLSEIHIQKMKYEHLGQQGMVEARYNMNSGRFNNKHGDYDNSNWLVPDAPQSALDLNVSYKDLQINQTKVDSDLVEGDVPF